MLQSAFALLAACALLGFTRPASAQIDEITHGGAFAVGSSSVTKTGSLYKLRFVGDETIEYQIDVAHPDVAGGMLRVFEATSGAYPLTIGGAVLRAANGVVKFPIDLKATCTLTQHSMSADSVVLDYTDAIEGLHHRRHTFQLRGKSLRIRIQDLDANLAGVSNYTGIYTGPTLNTPDARVIVMQGALQTPLVLFQQGSQHYFLAQALDLAQSNASNWSTQLAKNAVITPTTINYSSNTVDLYAKLSDGKLAAALDDAISLVITQRLQDALLTTTAAASPYRELLEDRTVVLLSGSGGNWFDYDTLFNLFDTWGMDNLAGYFFYSWSAAAIDPPLLSNAGPDWSPAKSPAGFAAMMSHAAGLGYPLAAYTTFNVMPPGAPPGVYDAGRIARKADGSLKLAGQTGLPLMAETAMGLYMASETALLKSVLGASMGYLDVTTYSSPTRGADGDHTDQMAGSPWAKTLRQACAARKAAMQASAKVFEGPILGEGSIATQLSNTEWLWIGSVDSVQRVINTGSNKKAALIPATDARAVTAWPVIPEFEYRVMAQKQANHGNGFADRFFGPVDGPTMVDASGNPLYPLGEAALDRYRLYELTYGHTSYFQTNGPFNGTGNVAYFADMLKEYYLCNALQSHYLGSPIAAIEYLQGGVLKSFEQILFASESIDSFKDAQIRLSFQDGMRLYLNHAPTPWVVNAGGLLYTLPEDGFLAHIPGSQFIAFSAIPPTTGGQRIDYCYAPGQWEMMDGRGQINAYGGLTTNNKRYLAVHNFPRNVTLVEQGLNGAIAVSQGPLPALVSVTIEPALSLLPRNQRLGLKAIAHYADGSFRNVTTLIQWSSSSAVVRVDQAGAATGQRRGIATIQGGSFGGVAVTPAQISVP